MELGKLVVFNLGIAVKSLCNFKVRSMLAVMGVLLGTLSLIVVFNITESMTIKAERELGKLGKNMVIIRSGIVRRFGSRVRLFTTAASLTVHDANAVREKIEYIERVTPLSSSTFPVTYGQKSLNDILVLGINNEYQYVRNHFPMKGRFITADDERGLKRNIVLGSKIADELFVSESPIGKYVMIFRAPCRVIGVMEEKGVDVSGVDQDRQIFMSLETFQRRFVNRTNLNMILVSIKNESVISHARKQIVELMRERHNIKPGQEDDFSVLSLKDIMELKEKAMQLVSIIGKIAAFLSFLIGGIGILSIMVLIVSERRLEIGLRRSVGSRKRDIIVQFMTEAAFISFSGAICGLIIGTLITVFIYFFTSLPFAFSAVGVFSSFSVSILVGIAAGIYPSKRAVQIQPVDIIRE